jgi:hypothetical protein
MPSIMDRIVFHEPSGLPNALALFVMSLIFLSIYVYYWFLGSPPSVAAIFISVGFALSGVAESLPKHRRRTVGVFRVVSMIVFVSLLVIAIFAPRFL